MNIILWILQILLALHTIVGAIWKFTNPAQAVSSTYVLPNGVWVALSVIEILCSLGLVLAIFKKSLGRLIPLAALIIAAEMFFFTGIQILSGSVNSNEIVYWLVVAAFSLFIAYGRFVLKPVQREK